MTDHSLTTRNLAIGYGNHALLSNLNLELRAGNMTALLGSNGRGKSTLLKTLSGFLRPVKGVIEIGGMPINQLSPKSLARLLAIVNTHRTQASLTVEELVEIGRQPHTGFLGRMTSHDHEMVESAMERTGILSYRRRIITTLSDGERQKAMIARALAQDTPIILLDEPTSFLDAASRLETMNLLRQLADGGKSILISTHDISEAMHAATHAWLIAEEIITGTVSEIVKSEAMESLFPNRGLKFDKKSLNFTL